MADYQQTQQVDASADEVFAWLADVENLPEYLPPVEQASIEGPSEGDNPGQKLRTTLQRPDETQSTFVAEGYLSVDESSRRMEWGAEADRDYSGWLTVAEVDEGSAEVTVHLSFGQRSAESEIESQPDGPDPIEEGIAATLESIRRQIEEGSGKLAPPPPPEGAGPSLQDNPAVVDG